MPNTILGGNEYGLAEAAILSERWLSTTTLPDVLARPAVVTAAVEQSALLLRRVIIRKRGSELVVEVNAHRPLSTEFLKSIEAVVELLNLPPGWNSYSAKPIGPQIAVRAIRILAELMEPLTPLPAVVPRVQGGIQLEWHTDTLDIEVYIDTPDQVSFFAEHGESGQSVEASLAGQEQTLRAWVQRLSRK